MTIPFAVFFERLRQATDIGTQNDLAKALGVNRSAVTQAKLRDAVPSKWVLTLARRYTLSPDWLEFGTGIPLATVGNGFSGSALLRAVARNAGMPGLVSSQGGGQVSLQGRPGVGGTHSGGARAATMPGEDTAAARECVYVPKVAARLCAGGGSFEVEAVPVAEYPFPRDWLARMGRPSAMVCMDVVGDSMVPGILDGDTVLVDQSERSLDPRALLAVGVEDGIYIKRAEQWNGGLVLRSDNPNYNDMELYGDELDSFRVLGRVVWLCRRVGP